MTDTADPPPRPRAGQLLDLLRHWWPGWRDVACIIYLVTATFHLVGNDGGRPFRPMLPLLALAVIAIIATLPTLAATPRWMRLLMLAWVLGPLIAFAFADVRAGWVRPVAAWAIAVPAALSTLHLLRRRWGAWAIAVIVGLSLTIAWYYGLLIWWGGGTARGEPAWMTLSWHNQSGTLMAVLGIGGLGIALARIGWPRVIGVVATALGLSGTWLSGSRGAVITAAVAVIVMLAIAVRRPRGDDHTDDPKPTAGAPHARSPVFATLVVTAVATALTVVVVLGLSSMWSGSTISPDDEATGGVTAQPLTERDQDAVGNLRARFGHWEAAVRMFATSPLTGTGPGSYQWSSLPVYRDDTNLTASAHGEQLEALGEFGLVGGGAALALTFGLAWLVLGAIRRPGRHHLEVAAAGVATLLVGHAALDFDWDYPILLSLLAIAAAALVAARLPQGRDVADQPVRTSASDLVLTTSTVVVAIVLVAAGVTGIVLQLQGTTPWALDRHIAQAVTSAADGDRAATDHHLDTLRRWNPGAPRLEDVTALAAHALGDLPDDDLAEAIDPERSAFADQLRAATQLLAADRPELALSTVEQARPILDRRQRWGVTSRVAEASSIALAARHRLGGCDAVDAAWPDIHDWLTDHQLDADVLIADPGEEATTSTWQECDLTTPRDG